MKQQAIKESTQEQSEERDQLSGSLKLKIQTGRLPIQKKSVTDNISRTNTVLSKIDTSKGSKNSSKASGSTKHKGKVLLDKIMSQRSKSKQKGLKKQYSGSKKSLKNNNSGLQGFIQSDIPKEMLKKNSSQSIRADIYDKSLVANRPSKQKTELKTNNLTKFRKFTQNLLESNNKYLKRIGKKNNLFEMRKLTENLVAGGNEPSNFASGEFHHFANSVHYEDMVSVDSHGRHPRGLYDTVGKLCHFGGTSPGKFYNLFQAKGSIDHLAVSVEEESCVSEEHHSLVNPQLEKAMVEFKDLLRSALEFNEKKVNKSLRRAVSRPY